MDVSNFDGTGRELMIPTNEQARPAGTRAPVALDGSANASATTAMAGMNGYWRIQDVAVPSDIGQLGMRCALDALGAKVLKSTPVMVSCPNGRRVPGTVLTVGYPARALGRGGVESRRRK